MFVGLLVIMMMIGGGVIAKLPTTIESRHRNRHSAHHRNHQPLLAGCQDPIDLSDRFMTWFKESNLSIIGGGSSNTDVISIDDDWQQQSPESSVICDQRPDTDSESTVMQRSLCPWEWRINRDDNREPKLLSEAYCSCRKSRGYASGALCMPIKREIPVLKRILCDPITRRYEYVRAVQTITVGCHSVLPRSQKASPLYNHYRTAPREI